MTCVGTRVQCGSWPGLTRSMAACWPLVAMIGKLFCGRSRTRAGAKSMNIQTMTHQVGSCHVHCYEYSYHDSVDSSGNDWLLVIVMFFVMNIQNVTHQVLIGGWLL